MNEIESRILDVNAEEIIAKLEMLGATKIHDANQRSHIFKKEGLKGYFRIREEQNQIVVTLKTKMENSAHAKIRDEQERTTDSVEQAWKDVEALGFTFSHTYDKYRIEYAIGDTHFCLDTHENLPTFLEIESPTEEEIFTWAANLGFSKDKLDNRGTKKLYKHYGTQRESS
jgi:adenylate cyclase class 2